MESIHSKPGNLRKAFALCGFAYVLALVVAIAIGFISREFHPIIIVLFADIGATLVIYSFSRIFQNTSFYDAYWSLAPLAIAMYWALGVSSESVVVVRQIIVITLVFIWSLRLTYNWASQWKGLKHEDWRYTSYRKKLKRWFWLIELVGLEMVPTIIVFLACLSLYSALTVGGNSFGTLDIIAILFTTGAITIEVIADLQLRRFREKQGKIGETMTKGLWSYSRHPNYFGEVMFWWGLYLFALAAEPSYWWTIIGPVAMTVLFFVVSIRLMERRSLERRPGYNLYKERIPAFFPWFPRK